MGAALRRSDYEALLALVEETVGLPDLDSFRAAVLERLDRTFASPAVAFMQRLRGAARVIPSRGLTETELLEKYPEVVRDQLYLLDNHPQLAPRGGGIATRLVPERVLKENAVFQVLWPLYGIRDAVAAFVRTREGDSAGIGVTCSDARPARVERVSAFLARLRPYFDRVFARFTHLERLGVRLGTLEDVTEALGPALLVDSKGGASWLSAAARRLFIDLTGRPDPPASILALCAQVQRALARRMEDLLFLGDGVPVALGPRTLVVRCQPTRSGSAPNVLVTIDDPSGRRRSALRAGCLRLELSPRERDVVGLVGEGLLDKMVASRLGIATQTVKSHLKRIFRRTGARNRTDLIRILIENAALPATRISVAPAPHPA